MQLHQKKSIRIRASAEAEAAVAADRLRKVQVLQNVQLLSFPLADAHLPGAGSVEGKNIRQSWTLSEYMRHFRPSQTI